MRAPLVALAVVAAGTALCHGVAAQSSTPTTPLVQAGPPPLLPALTLDSVALGYASTPSNRVFLALASDEGHQNAQVVEIIDGKPKPFPDAGWNGWTAGADASKTFVHVHAVRVGPEGELWIVDSGAPGFDHDVVPNGPKVVRIDLASNAVRVYPLGTVTDPKSRIDDIRFHGSLAYLTDAGSPGMIVLDIATGKARRALDGDPSMTAQRPITADDHILRGMDGKPVKIHTDQMEVSPDGKYFFYQPASGPMSRISTRYLDDPKLSNRELAKHITTFSKTNSSGGSAIDSSGTIYISDTDKRRILTILPDGRQRVLVQDPRLIWVAAMWLDSQGWLIMPAAQLDRMAPFNNGVSKLQLPITVYKMRLGVKPPLGDHP